MPTKKIDGHTHGNQSQFFKLPLSSIFITPMSIKVAASETSETNPSQGKDTCGEQSLSTRFLVQEGRTSATKGLLHDFSNVMVGLCSLSENALDEAEPGSPLHDDMEIIRDSAVRAHHLIRRIAALNTGDTAEPGLLDVLSWLRNEAETIRATLPKGSEVTVPGEGRTVLASVSESRLRDFIMMVTVCVAGQQQKSRISMDLNAVAVGAKECEIKAHFRNIQDPFKMPDTNGGTCPCSTAMKELAEQMGATCRTGVEDDGSVTLSLTLG